MKERKKKTLEKTMERIWKKEYERKAKIERNMIYKLGRRVVCEGIRRGGLGAVSGKRGMKLSVPWKREREKN